MTKVAYMHLKVLIVICYAIFITSSAKEHLTRKHLTTLQSIKIGSTIGMGEIIFPGHALFTIMNQRIDKPGIPLNLNPKFLYRGVLINALLKAPVISTQVAVNNKLRQYLSHNSELSNAQKISTSFASGIASSIIATPQEAIPVYMQKYELSTLETIRTIRLSIWRGFVALAMRDGAHAVGYQALAPITQKAVRTKIKNKTAANILGSVVAGVTTATASQPFTVIKTKMQGDPEQQIYKSMRKTIGTIYRREGPAGFFSGLVPRSTRFAMGVPIYAYFYEKLTKNMLKDS
jgi:hypothetical protein